MTVMVKSDYKKQFTKKSKKNEVNFETDRHQRKTVTMESGGRMRGELAGNSHRLAGNTLAGIVEYQD